MKDLYIQCLVLYGRDFLDFVLRTAFPFGQNNLSIEMADSISDKETISANRRVFFANAVVILSSFQYGVDFGLIGGLQAMPGFLSVSYLKKNQPVEERPVD
jgi:hypothetical protein